MKLRKKRKKDKLNNNNLKKTLLILTMLISVTIAMITYWIYAYYHKYGTFYFDETKLVSYKIEDYLEIKGDLVYLKNTNKDIINNFISNQRNIILNNDVVNVDITKTLYNEILSVMIKYTTNKNSNGFEQVITLNVDLKKDIVLTNEELLDKVGINYKEIAINIFNEYIKLPSDYSSTITDTITDTKLTPKEFNENSEKYIIRIREKLPDIINLYIENDKLKYTLNIEEIYKVCYYTNTNKLVNINKELGQI